VGRIRVLTANLYNDRADAAAFGDLVASLEPDVVAVQELGPGQASVLARLLPHGTLAPATNHRGMGIALRRPGVVTRLRLGARDGWLAEVAVPDGGPVEVLNVHVTAPHVMPPWRMVADRRAQLRDLLAHLDAGARRPLVLIGDLNSTPRWPLYRRLKSRLDDAADLAARGNGSGARPTWGPWPGARRLFRIDHVLVRGLTPIALRVVDLAGSDHSALVVDLEAPAPA
jgi:vancomycin resistance protein VanJ